MPLLILLLILSLPLIEIVIFVEVGSEIGAIETLLLTIATAAAGVWIARAQGFGVIRAMQAATAAGEAPVLEMIHGLFLLMAGVLLLIPGFLTDAVGALLLLPPVRTLLAGLGLQNMVVRGAQGNRTNTVEAEYWEEAAPESAQEPAPKPLEAPEKED